MANILTGTTTRTGRGRGYRHGYRRVICHTPKAVLSRSANQHILNRQANSYRA